MREREKASSGCENAFLFFLPFPPHHHHLSRSFKQKPPQFAEALSNSRGRGGKSQPLLSCGGLGKKMAFRPRLCSARGGLPPPARRNALHRGVARQRKDPEHTPTRAGLRNGTPCPGGDEFYPPQTQRHRNLPASSKFYKDPEVNCKQDLGGTTTQHTPPPPRAQAFLCFMGGGGRLCLQGGKRFFGVGGSSPPTNPPPPSLSQGKAASKEISDFSNLS